MRPELSHQKQSSNDPLTAAGEAARIAAVTEEPESLILELLRQMRAELGDVRSDIGQLRAEFATKSDLNLLRPTSIRSAPTSPPTSSQPARRLSEQIVGLRRAVIEYHTSVIGHGILISELEARMRRVEQHLNLPSLNPS